MSVAHPTAEAFAALESRVAELEKQFAALVASATDRKDAPARPTPAPDPIPWNVIAAAVAAVVPEAHRILSIEMMGLPPMNLWSFEGRRAIFMSHSRR